MRCRQHAPVTSSDPSIRWRLPHKMEDGKGNQGGRANLMVEGGRGNKDGKTNKIVAGRINRDGKANLVEGGRGNKDGKANHMKGGKVNRCSRSLGSDVPLNYRRDLREMADNRACRELISNWPVDPSRIRCVG
jgi:hypothetical protein